MVELEKSVGDIAARRKMSTHGYVYVNLDKCPSINNTPREVLQSLQY